MSGFCLGFDALVFAPMAQVTIDTIKNGPYIITGEVELIDVALSLRGRTSYWCMEWTAAVLHRMVRVKSQIRY